MKDQPITGIREAYEGFMSGRQYDVCTTLYNAFCAGAGWVQEQKEEQTGYTITEEQLRKLWKYSSAFHVDEAEATVKEICPAFFDEPKPTYKVGDRFRHVSQNEYLLARCSSDLVCLVNMVSGLHYSLAVHVGNSSAITESEWQELTEYKESSFELIE